MPPSPTTTLPAEEAIGDSFPVDQYFTIKKDNRKRSLGPAQIGDHIFLLPTVKDILLTRKLLEGQKGTDAKSTYPLASLVDSLLAERYVCTQEDSELYLVLT